jgi:hypothetical protein
MTPWSLRAYLLKEGSWSILRYLAPLKPSRAAAKSHDESNTKHAAIAILDGRRSSLPAGCCLPIGDRAEILDAPNAQVPTLFGVKSYFGTFIVPGFPVGTRLTLA